MVVNRALLCLVVIAAPASIFGTTGTPFDKPLVREMDRIRSLQTEINRRTDEYREPVSSFGPEQRRFIRQWFSDQARRGKLPRAFSDGGTLSDPFNLELNQVLPPALLESSLPLPPALELELPALPSNLKRLVVSGNVLLVEATASTIVDVIHDVF